MSMTTKDYAALSKDAYSQRSKWADVVVGDVAYQVIDTYSDPITGFYGAAYQRKGTGEIAIVYRGTQTDLGVAQDGLVDLGMVATGLNAQLPDARRFTQHVLDYAESKAAHDQAPVARITVTGHSLGGTQAEAMGYEFGLSGETFNAYGAADLLHNIPEGGTRIVNHVRATDVVSAAGRHFGTVQVLATQQEVNRLVRHGYDERTTIESLRNPLGMISLEAHGIEAFAPKDPTLTPSVLSLENVARARAHRHAIELYRDDIHALRSHTLSAPWELAHKVETAKHQATLGVAATLHGDRDTAKQLADLTQQRVTANVQHALDTAANTGMLGIHAIDRSGEFVADQLKQGAEDVRYGVERTSKDVVQSLQLTGQAIHDGVSETYQAIHERIAHASQNIDALMPHWKDHSAPSLPALRLDNPLHPDHGLYQQARDAVHRLDAEKHRTPDQRSDQLAAALTVEARRHGLNHIDHVLLSTDANRVYAVQGDLQGIFKRHVDVTTVEAVNKPIEQSSAAWRETMQQQKQEEQVSQQTVQQARGFSR